MPEVGVIQLEVWFRHAFEPVEAVVAVDDGQGAEDLDQPQKATSAEYAELDKVTPDAVLLEQPRHLRPDHVVLEPPDWTVDGIQQLRRPEPLGDEELQVRLLRGSAKGSLVPPYVLRIHQILRSSWH